MDCKGFKKETSDWAKLKTMPYWLFGGHHDAEWVEMKENGVPVLALCEVPIVAEPPPPGEG